MLEPLNTLSTNWKKLWMVDDERKHLKHQSGLTLKFVRIPFGKSFYSCFTVLQANQTILNLSDLTTLKQQAHAYLADLSQIETKNSSNSKVNIFREEDFSHPVPLLIAMSKEITEMNQAIFLQQKAVDEYKKHGLAQPIESIRFGQTAFESFYLPKLEFYQKQKNIWEEQIPANDTRLQQSLNNFQGWIDSLKANIEIMMAFFQKSEVFHQGKPIH